MLTATVKLKDQTISVNICGTAMAELKQRFPVETLETILIETLAKVATKDLQKLADAGADPAEVIDYAERHWAPGSMAPYLKLRKTMAGLTEAEKAYLKKVL